ncbi:MAG: peptidase MA family metallohydrolase [Negativicutes bacterium]|nr:peptidase MA family metallohydrolase [Negativicutes bacterium]
MHKVTILDGALIAVLLLAILVLFQMPVRLQLWLYPVVRQATEIKLNYETRSLAVYETRHFTIKYGPKDADVVAMVAEAAEKAYQPVTEELDYAPTGKTLIVLYPSRRELNQAFGWSGDQSVMGAYWGGVIQVLSPHEWLQQTSPEEFIRSGPMVHEFTHLVFDHMTGGNYPRWFTEGLAQYVEYRVNHYEWRSPTNSMAGQLYTMAELDANFDALTDQSLAYRESLAAVRYIAEVYGEGKLQQVMSALAAGKNMQQAITASLGTDYGDYEAAWQKWAAANMLT